ncbi:heterogeneous nuclear ribonucleo 1-like [Olea europaea subsp. europaea]|uniref:Heterogeneous nuclear ribonucleo 1-like n=1 Tax=Olea europaea subsp. europaea TaxID=158383 RepID=A0A8S0RGE1_OLEEU|nr:heterogeneous nuclear ribonucleo 1-like [Olea europaea subsp. europaea]
MDSDQGKLFIGGISWETDEEKLKEHFQGYGEVLQAVVMRDKITGKPRGFGFVVFADPNILDTVLQERHVIDGRTVEAKRALSREEQQVSKGGNPNTSRNFGGVGNTRTKKIFVGGLPPILSEDGFRDYFEAYGTVTDVVIMYDQQTNRPRGFGFISFDSEDAVDRVLHKTFHDLNGKHVEVKRALPKDANPGGSGRSMGGGTGGGSVGGYQGYGSSFGDSRMDSSRYMQSQNAGAGYPPYGPSGFNTSAFGYGPGNNGMGYGGYGNYGSAGSGYGNPNAPNAQRSSWGSQAPSGYGNMSYGNSQWGSPNPSAGNGLGSGGLTAGQPSSGTTGYGNQGYGYGVYGGNDGTYGNQAAAYGAVGGRTGSGPNGSAPAGELQAGPGGYMGGGYSDAGGNFGYGNSGWRSDPSQASGQQSNGPHGGQAGYGGGYGSGPTRQAQQQ